MKKLYVIRLSVEERDRLEALVHTGQVAAYKRRQTLAPGDVVHSAEAGRRLRVRDGAGAGGL